MATRRIDFIYQKHGDQSYEIFEEFVRFDMADCRESIKDLYREFLKLGMSVHGIKVGFESNFEYFQN